MASNKEYIAQAEELAKELGLEISTDGLKNDELGALVSDLKAKKKDAENPSAEEAEAKAAENRAAAEAKAEEARAKAAAEAKAKVVKPPPYYVKEGKAITTKRGIRSDGEGVTPADFPGGAGTLEALIDKGYVGKS